MLGLKDLLVVPMPTAGCENVLKHAFKPTSAQTVFQPNKKAALTHTHTNSTHSKGGRGPLERSLERSARQNPTQSSPPNPQCPQSGPLATLQ